MFTLTVQDERVYRQLMERVEKTGESLDVVLLELLNQKRESDSIEELTPARKLLRLIDDTDLPFTNEFNARDAEDILSAEAGRTTWRTGRADHGSS